MYSSAVLYNYVVSLCRDRDIINVFKKNPKYDDDALENLPNFENDFTYTYNSELSHYVDVRNYFKL